MFNFFLQEGERVPVELSHAEDGSMVINPLPPATLPPATSSEAVDVVNDDLDISDSDDEAGSDHGGNTTADTSGHHHPEPPPPDEDGIWF